MTTVSKSSSPVLGTYRLPEIPRSTVTGWLGESPKRVVTLDVVSLKEQELQRQNLLQRQRIRKLQASVRVLPTLIRLSG